jgi:hypothetical protein
MLPLGLLPFSPINTLFLGVKNQKKTEGETKMRKETTARLLLSLFTAFIMVAGALGAALPGLTHDEGNEV